MAVDHRTNTILVRGGSQADLSELETVVKQLDQPSPRKVAVGDGCRIGLARLRMAPHRRYALMGLAVPEYATCAVVETIQPPRML